MENQPMSKGKLLKAYNDTLWLKLYKTAWSIEKGSKTVVLNLRSQPLGYFDTPILSNSKLSHPDGLSVKDSTLRLGTLTHDAVYQPTVFDQHEEAKQYAVATSYTLLPYNLALTENEKLAEHALLMSKAALKCPVLNLFVSNVSTHVEIETYALLWGVVPVKVKLDAKLGKLGHDLKTTACKTRAEFIAKMAEYGYWRQAVLYKEVHNLSNFYFTAVCKTAPYQTFLIDTSQFKAEMKQAKLELEALVADYLEANPDYVIQAYQFLDEYIKVQA